MGGDNQAGLAWCRELLESFAVPSRLSLSHDYVAQLLSEPSPENRAATAENVGEFYADGEPSEAEKAIAQDIFRAMVRDAEVRVREALAQTLKESPDLPSDVARTLAADVDSVALPVIEYSQVLTDEDLIEILETEPPAWNLPDSVQASNGISSIETQLGSDRDVYDGALRRLDGWRVQRGETRKPPTNCTRTNPFQSETSC